ncbi:MAG: cation:proton antiporter subunit C [Bacteroidales bacterium]|nr:cation:proton antiporter subunit C [Bacteroidales bacterium]MCF8326855.1 cation:proton antiporter subunit C [Bacteroidales bacterium]
MEIFQLEYITLITGGLLVLTGLWGIISQKNLIRMVIGFSLFDTGLHVIMISIGYIRNGTAPILDKAVDKVNAAGQIVDPLPQALVLTAIVIGLGVTALMLAYVVRLHKEKGSLNITNFKDLKW